jgi:hypothetical protein
MAEEWDSHLQPSNHYNVKIFQMLAHDTNSLNNVINLFS